MPHTLDLYLAGEWTQGTGDRHHRLVSPVTGEHIADVPIASTDDVDRAVAAARTAQEDFRFWSPFERADLLHRIASAIEARVPEIARIQTLEQGKPYHAESLADIAEANQYFLNAAEDVKRLSGETIPTTDRNKRMFTFHRPVGVWAAITPWNFPVMIPLEYLGPGLATGNAVIAKPPEFTCWALLELAKAFDEAGVPKGLVSIIPGAGDIGSSLVQHSGVDAVGFTGSSATGRKDHRLDGDQAVDHGDVGQRPDHRHRRRRRGRRRPGGGLRRLLQRRPGVLRHRAGDRHRGDPRRVRGARSKAAGDAVLGDPFDEATTMGPLNNEPTAAKMDRHIADAVDRGAEVLVGGGRASGHPTDLYYDLTILDRVSEEAEVSQEESFGPVLPILTAADDDEAVAVANRTRLGLQAAVFTDQPEPGVLVRRPDPVRHRRRQRLHRLLGDVPAVRRRRRHRYRMGQRRNRASSPTCRPW